MLHMKPVVLIVLDGLGHRESAEDNAVSQARKTTWPHLFSQYPHTLLHCSGLAVGLPDGQMGNSEVGHTILGGGRIVYQDLVRISKSISDGDFFENPELVAAVEAVKQTGGVLHLLGLTSPGGIHSSLEHGYALCELAKRRGLSRVAWHAFLDGRDTPPQSAVGFVEQVETRLRDIGVGRLASLCGRFYSMDRDNRWERLALGYFLLTRGEGQKETASNGAKAALLSAYARGETDEFIKPIVLTEDGHPIATISDGDAVVFWNFRADRARQMSRALTQPSFDAFDRGKQAALARYVCMTQYDAKLGLPIAFPPQSLRNNLGEYLANLGHAQFRIAETVRFGPRHERRRSHRRNCRCAFAKEIRFCPCQLCESRHGGTHGHLVCGNPGRRDHGRMPRANLRGCEAGRSGSAHHRRSWQLRTNARSTDGTTSHRSHHESGSVCRRR